MCGILAYFSNDSFSIDLTPGLKRLNHRGPDSHGTWYSPDGSVGLGHTRLAIMDLEHGFQPISNEDETIHAIVNGEFYEFEKIKQELTNLGHVFKTNCDSEICVHLYEQYGLSMMDYLQGEFAFCLWDSVRSLFIVARDRFGIKPVHYMLHQSKLWIASEAKAFLEFGWQPEWDLDSIMNCGFVMDYRTYFKGVSKVPPGHYLTMTKSGTMNIKPYWDADYPNKFTKEIRTKEEMILETRRLLVDAVRKRLRSDVPVGLYLSGGIDSSCVLGIATKLLREQNPQSKMTAFTISFVDGKKLSLDEGDIAERMAEYCDAEFVKLEVTEKDLSDAFEDTVYYVEAPVFNMNACAKYLLSEKVRDSGFKVVLTGEGSDEHFAGYSWFYPDNLREADYSMPIKLSNDARISKLQKLERNDNNQWERISNVSMSFDDHVVGRRMFNGISTHRQLYSIFGIPTQFVKPEYRLNTPDPIFTASAAVSGIARHKARTKWHPLHSALYIETKLFLSNILLNHLGDRIEMAHSVEARTPFLDHYVTEYVNNIPPSLKMYYENDQQEFPVDKWILREAVKPYINEELYKRVKHPFLAPPAAESYKSHHAIVLMKKLTRENVDKLGWMNFEAVQGLMDRFKNSGDQLALNCLNTALSFVVLQERFNVKKSAC